jgi:hypothetical protein
VIDNGRKQDGAVREIAGNFVRLFAAVCLGVGICALSDWPRFRRRRLPSVDLLRLPWYEGCASITASRMRTAALHSNTSDNAEDFEPQPTETMARPERFELPAF